MPGYGTNGFNGFYGPYGQPMNIPSYPAPYQGNQMGYTPFQPMTAQQQNIQQAQPQPQIVQISGRMVNSADDILPNEVQMDGRNYYFPSFDGSCIYVKAWNKNGKLDMVKYVLDTVEQAPKESQLELMLNSINERLSKIEKSLTE